MASLAAAAAAAAAMVPGVWRTSTQTSQTTLALPWILGPATVALVLERTLVSSGPARAPGALVAYLLDCPLTSIVSAPLLDSKRLTSVPVGMARHRVL